VTDEDGFCRHTDLTPANRSEVTHFEQVVKAMPRSKGMRVYSDKGNASEANREILKEQGLKDGIMHKVARGKPLSKRQKQINRIISEIRYIVEQGFGTLKRLLGFARVAYFGLDEVHSQAIRKMMCLNLIKAANMIELVVLVLAPVPSFELRRLHDGSACPENSFPGSNGVQIRQMRYIIAWQKARRPSTNGPSRQMGMNVHMCRGLLQQFNYHFSKDFCNLLSNQSAHSLFWILQMDCLIPILADNECNG